MTSPSFPLMPPRSTEARLLHLDETAYRADPTTVIYRLVDALCGDGGAGGLKKDTLLERLSEMIEGLYFSDLDYIFGGIGLVPRAGSESYDYDPSNDMLTSDEWDEVRVKDAWYRARIKDFFAAASKGGTPEGIRLAIMAGSSVDCDIHEVWRYMDNFGLTGALGRAPVSTRSEFVVTPHKQSLGNKEYRLLRQMLTRICPADSIVTIDLNGLSTTDPIEIRTVASDSSYFEVQKKVTGSPVLQDIPPPELLAIDLRPSEEWLLSGNPETAPYAAFNITQEYGYYYLASGGARSPIDSVSYDTLGDDGETLIPEENHEDYEIVEKFTPWQEYERADSPDNYPGGKFGRTPEVAPAINPDGSSYDFPYDSQEQYRDEVAQDIVEQGGQADEDRFRLPLVARSTTKKVYTPDLSIAWAPPIKDSTVTESWTSSHYARKDITDLNNYGASAGWVN